MERAESEEILLMKDDSPNEASSRAREPQKIRNTATPLYQRQ